MSEPAPLLAPLKPAVIQPRLWNGTAFVDEPWRVVADDAPLPIAGHAILSVPRWRAEQAALSALGLPIGLLVQPSESLEPATDDIARLALVALVFPRFSDGRAYSTARRLRDVWGYRGEIRATGDVLLDQLPLMLRCGFDSFEIVNAATVRELEASVVPAVTRVYQTAADTVPRPWHSRRAALRQRPAA